tara:strand:- start:43 stop:777 length:735 start_codon:yes stop_codon:yes gene_type:complete
MNLRRGSNIEELYRENDIIITCLPSGKHVEKLYYEENAMSFIKKNQIIIDMSTSKPDLMLKLEKDLKIKKAFIADAPIARTRQAAIDGTLAIMVGATSDIFKKIKSILELMGSDIIHCGPVGTGQFTKIMNNMILFQNVLALSEASKIAEHYKIDAETLFKNISNCSGDSFALKNHGLKSIVQDNFPNLAFSVKYAQKDLSYALEMANQMGLSTHGCTTINNLFTKAIDEGYGDLYFPVIKKIL